MFDFINFFYSESDTQSYIIIYPSGVAEPVRDGTLSEQQGLPKVLAVLI